MKQTKIRLCPQCNTMKRFGVDAGICGKCVREKSAPNPDVTRVEEMDWEMRFDIMMNNLVRGLMPFQSREDHISGFLIYGGDDLFVDEKKLKNFIREAISTAVKEERERIVDGVRLMEIYDIDDTSRSVINMHGYNDAIKDVIEVIQPK